MTDSIFAPYRAKAWPFLFEATLEVVNIHGGVPNDPKVAEGWLRTKVQEKDSITQSLIASIMMERGVDENAALEEAATSKVNGFKRDPDSGELYVEGRQLKSALKEAANIAVGAGKVKRKWGETGKGLKNFIAEHVSVQQDRLYLGTKEADYIDMRFTRSQYGSSITREEVVESAVIDFTIAADYKFTDEEWAIIWLTGQEQGLGASRSQGYGTYTVTRWDQVAVPKK